MKKLPKHSLLKYIIVGNEEICFGIFEDSPFQELEEICNVLV